MDFSFLKKEYQKELFDDFLPKVEKYAVDYELGGFMCDFDYSKNERITENKATWYEGRGIWFFSYLYNNLNNDRKYLEIAKRSVDFIMKFLPKERECFPGTFTRDGQIINKDGDIFGNLYVAEGLIAYGTATKSDDFLLAGKKLLIQSLNTFTASNYVYKPYAQFRGAKFLNHWMVTFWSVSQYLNVRGDDKEMNGIMDLCLGYLLNGHLIPEFNLLVDVIFTNDKDQKAISYKDIGNFGVSIQTAWMIMYEGKRRRSDLLFSAGTKLFKNQVNVARDRVYGGYLGFLNSIKNNEWRTNKILTLHEEVLIGTLFLIEQSNDKWAMDTFNETFVYVWKNFKKNNLSFWGSGGDRKLKSLNTTRIDFYHHSRHLMFNLLTLKRISTDLQ